MIDIMALRQLYARRELQEIRWINGEDNLADAMTKATPKTALERFLNSSEHHHPPLHPRKIITNCPFRDSTLTSKPRVNHLQSTPQSLERSNKIIFSGAVAMGSLFAPYLSDYRIAKTMYVGQRPQITLLALHGPLS